MTNDLNVDKNSYSLGSPQKPDRMRFYKDWQDRLYR